ncbi:MAG: M50 family metallopeptidase [Phycisphaerales bacterium]|nr:M50 family metallopeptidase [Phycisphaerales bacterium]
MSEPHSQSRTIYILSVLTVLAFSWLYMQWTHELGHILTGIATGAELDRVILNPFRFSMTQFASNPRPHLTTWGGPVLGVLIGAGVPILLSTHMKSVRASLLIVAAFVMIANGLYIGLGAFHPIADTSDLVRHGSPRWVLGVFGLVCVIVARALVIPAIYRAWDTSSMKCCWPFGILTLALGATGFIFFG